MKSTTCFFSVIIPTHNRPVELKRAVESVLKQTYNNYEIIIVNNGTIEIENNFQSDKITIIREEKKGGNYARNTGVNLSKGIYVCFLDDDDEYLPNHLDILYNLILKNNSEIGLYRTLTKLEISGNNYVDQEFIFCPDQIERLNYAMTYLVFMASVCLPKVITDKYKFDPLITIAQDYHLWLRVLSEYPLFESNVVTTIYHRSDESVSKPSPTKYKKYIQVYSDLFKIKSIGSKISSKIKKDRIFKYYFWLLCEFKKELTYKEYASTLLNIVFYNPKILFDKKLYAVILK